MAAQKLWVPGRPITDEPPGYRCLNCGQQFKSQTKYIRHGVKCVTKDDSGIRRHMSQTEDNIFTGEMDSEAMDWVRKRNAEGKPSAKKGRPA